MKPPSSVKHAGESLERELESRLRVLLESIPGLGSGAKVWRNPAASDRSFDIMAELEVPRTKERVEFRVECKELPRPSQFPFVNLQRAFGEDG